MLCHLQQVSFELDVYKPNIRSKRGQSYIPTNFLKRLVLHLNHTMNDVLF